MSAANGAQRGAHPILQTLRGTSFALQVAIYLFILENLVSNVLNQRFGFPAGSTLLDASLALFACCLYWSFYPGRDSRVRRTPSRWSLLWFSPLLLPILYPLHSHIYASLASTLPFLLLYVVQSTQKVVIFDGILLHPLAAKHRWYGVTVIALLQGAMAAALFAIVVPPADGYVPLLVFNAASTAGMTFAYAALRLRTGVLWPLVVADILGSVTYFITLSPHPSPYPLTPYREAFFLGHLAFGLLVGGLALLSMRRLEAEAGAGVSTIEPEPAKQMESGVVAQLPAANVPVEIGKRHAISCLGIFVGIVVLTVSSFAAFAQEFANLNANTPQQYQQASRNPYSAVIPGHACDKGGAVWIEDDPDRYVCQADGLLITQTTFDYEAEDYFAFVNDDNSSASFIPHHYRVQVQANIVSGDPGTCADIHIHVQEFQGRQWFSACSDGTWNIGRCDLHCQTDTQLMSGNLPKPTSSFLLLVDVTDNVMAFTVNGTLVGTLHDSTYTSTDQLVLAMYGPNNQSDPPAVLFSHFTYTPVS